MRVLIRADGGHAIGAGHVMRMIALANRIKRADGVVCFASSQLADSLEQRVQSHGIAVVRSTFTPGSVDDIDWVIRQVAEYEIQWVVADGYNFDEQFQEAMHDAEIPLLFVDDYGQCERYAADLVLNQNLSADRRLYGNCAGHTKLLLGPMYVLLRDEFLALGSAAVPMPKHATRILVTLGAADPVNATENVVRALGRIADPAMRGRVVVGPNNPNREQLVEIVNDARIEVLPATDNMPELMRWAHLAIAGVGSATYELCFMGVPTMLVVMAENQHAVARALDREGVCEDLGLHDDLDIEGLADRIRELCSSPHRRRGMSERGRENVDGRGSTRVLEAMYPHC